MPWLRRLVTCRAALAVLRTLTLSPASLNRLAQIRRKLVLPLRIRLNRTRRQKDSRTFRSRRFLSSTTSSRAPPQPPTIRRLRRTNSSMQVASLAHSASLPTTSKASSSRWMTRRGTRSWSPPPRRAQAEAPSGRRRPQAMGWRPVAPVSLGASSALVIALVAGPVLACVNASRFGKQALRFDVRESA